MTITTPTLEGYHVSHSQGYRVEWVAAESTHLALAARRMFFGDPRFDDTTRLKNRALVAEFSPAKVTVFSRITPPSNSNDAVNAVRSQELTLLLQAFIDDPKNTLMVAELTDDDIDDMPVYEKLGFRCFRDADDQIVLIYQRRND